MNELKVLCNLIVALLDGYSEEMFEEGSLTLSFDCKGYHYECELKRTIIDGDTNEES